MLEKNPPNLDKRWNVDSYFGCDETLVQQNTVLIFTLLLQWGDVVKTDLYYFDQNNGSMIIKISRPVRMTVLTMTDKRYILINLCILQLLAEALVSVSESSSNSPALWSPTKRKCETRGRAQRRLCICGHGQRERNGGGGGDSESEWWGERAELSSPLSSLQFSCHWVFCLNMLGLSHKERIFPSLFSPLARFLFIRFHTMPAKPAPSSCPKWLWTLLQWGTFSQRAMKGPFRWCWLCFDLSIRWERESRVQSVLGLAHVVGNRLACTGTSLVHKSGKVATEGGIGFFDIFVPNVSV